MNLLKWDVYELTSQKSPLLGVMLRGKLRKFSLENGFDLLCENASDKENCVRFALLDASFLPVLELFIGKIVSDMEISLLLSQIENPVLSKLKVNQSDRYGT